MSGGYGPAVFAANLQVHAGGNGLPAPQAGRLGDELESLIEAEGKEDGLVENHGKSFTGQVRR